ncbi:hypothetical protein F4778DRAFT_756725 [Xylariomycetidae sp. FL2044]|nr:hypothetical protein F4778DRAFT_756725 [Xylariomycetidae sp. FL2044]
MPGEVKLGRPHYQFLVFISFISFFDSFLRSVVGLQTSYLESRALTILRISKDLCDVRQATPLRRSLHGLLADHLFEGDR